MTATVTISLEIELKWGVHDKTGAERFDHLSPNRREETLALEKLLGLLDEHGVPITFDVVGHLFLSECSCSHRPAPGPGWYDDDPGTSVGEDPLFYAPDLIERIRKASVEHEFATHTFSHVLCDEIPSDVLGWELQQAKCVARDAGVPAPNSIVTPRHRPISSEHLRANNLEVLRVPANTVPHDPLRKFCWFLLRRHPVGDPVVEDGIVETPSSALESLSAPFIAEGQRNTHWSFSLIPRRVRKWLHERYLNEAVDRAVQEDSHIHLWSHLYNISNEVQFSLVERFVERLAARDDVQIKPMGELASDGYVDDAGSPDISE